jgi:hypothetical protein
MYGSPSRLESFYGSRESQILTWQNLVNFRPPLPLLLAALARNKREGPSIPTQDPSRGIQILSSTSTRFLKGQSQGNSNLEQSQGTTSDGVHSWDCNAPRVRYAYNPSRECSIPVTEASLLSLPGSDKRDHYDQL